MTYAHVERCHSIRQPIDGSSRFVILIPVIATRPFRFGLVFTGGMGGRAFADFAHRTEDDGFSTLLVADHLTNPMACGPLLVAAAAATSRIRVGSYVYANDFRHPAVLAKEAATVDVLSEGRFELGIGAGWDREEYDLAGIPFDEPKVRVDRLEESLNVITRLLAGDPVEHVGVHYRLHGLTLQPTPIQQPIPLLIGGGGPRMMTIAAHRADIVALAPQSLPEGGLDRATHPAEAFDRRIAALDLAVAAARRIDGGPERSILLFDLWRSLDDVVGQRAAIDPGVAATSPYVLIGDTSAMVETLHERRERWGLSYFVAFASDVNVDLFREVVGRMAA